VEEELGYLIYMLLSCNKLPILLLIHPRAKGQDYRRTLVGVHTTCNFKFRSLEVEQILEECGMQKAVKLFDSNMMFASLWHGTQQAGQCRRS